MTVKLRDTLSAEDQAHWDSVMSTKKETMPKVILRLEVATIEQAAQLADDIRSAGNLSYTDSQGTTAYVTVGDVTVEA